MTDLESTPAPPSDIVDNAAAATIAVADSSEPGARPRAVPAYAEPPDPSSWFARLITFFIVAGCVIFTIRQLQPSLLVANTTPAGGDMGAHVWGPRYLRDHLLAHGRLAGWSPDWYGGFPAYYFYMVVPALAVVVLDLVLPYGVAFKLISVSGVVAMPVAAYLMGRLARFRFPGPALLGVAATLFLFDSGFTIYGGNVLSTLAGEFAFSIALAVCLVYFGVVMRGLDTGRHRALGAALLALVVLCHPLVGIMSFLPLGTVAIAAIWLKRSPRSTVTWLSCVGVVGFALSAFWVVPFIWRRPYLNDMGWERLTTYSKSLMPQGQHGEWWAIWALVAAAILFGAYYRERLVGALVLLTVLLGLEFRFVPQGRLWNARVLPFYYLCLYLLAGLGVAMLARWVIPPVSARSLIALPAFGIALVLIGLPLGDLPGAKLAPNGKWDWYGFQAKQGLARSWAAWNYSGYERKPAYPEYQQMISTMDRLGKEQGCGRAMWEYDNDRLNAYGTPMSPMLLPMWTDGCIGSMEGLFFEASATTPYHFINQSELSARPSRAQRKLPYGGLDIGLGVQHMQLLGVRYYLAFTEAAVNAARLHPDLVEMRSFGGDADKVQQLRASPTPDQAQIDRASPWVVFEVQNASLVEPLRNEPVVLTNTTEAQDDWLQLAVQVYKDPAKWGVLPAATGPASWARAAVGDVDPAYINPDKNLLAGEPKLPELPVRELPTVSVTDIVEKDSSLSFTVDQINVPILVKTSYFPNWQVSGASGPYRVMPNLMVVVPTSNKVRLHYGYTGVDKLAYALTLLGGVGALILWRRRPLAVTGLAVSDAPLDADSQFWAQLAETHRAEAGSWQGGEFVLRAPASAPNAADQVTQPGGGDGRGRGVAAASNTTNETMAAGDDLPLGSTLLGNGDTAWTGGWFDGAPADSPVPSLLKEFTGGGPEAHRIDDGYNPPGSSQVVWIDRDEVVARPPEIPHPDVP